MYCSAVLTSIGICDVERLRQNVRGIDNEEEYNTLKDLIKDDNRQFPVVVFVASDDYWIEKFDVDYFAYLVGYYAHIKRIQQMNFLSNLLKIMIWTKTSLGIQSLYFIQAENLTQVISRIS